MLVSYFAYDPAISAESYTLSPVLAIFFLSFFLSYFFLFLSELLDTNLLKYFMLMGFFLYYLILSTRFFWVPSGNFTIIFSGLMSV